MKGIEDGSLHMFASSKEPDIPWSPFQEKSLWRMGNTWHPQGRRYT